MLDELVEIGFVDEAEGVYHAVGEGVRSVDEQPRAIASEQSLRALGKNVPAVYNAIGPSGSVTMAELRERTNLSAAQVRYALDPLLSAGYVVMVGGQGRRETVYNRR